MSGIVECVPVWLRILVFAAVVLVAAAMLGYVDMVGP